MAWTDVIDSLLETVESRRKQNIDVNLEQVKSRSDQAKQILDALTQGKIRPVQQGEQAQLYAPPEPVPPKNIGEALKQGFFGQNSYRQGAGYMTTAKEITSDELMKHELLKREFETAMGLGRQENIIPSIKQNTLNQEIKPMSTKTEEQNIIQSGEQPPPRYEQIQTGIDKYGNPEYVMKETTAYQQWGEGQKTQRELGQKKQEKLMETKLKQQSLKKELNSFFTIDKQIPRAAGGFVPTRMAGLKSQWQGISQPIDLKTGKVTSEAIAARQHEGARKRLRLKLVKDAGDVGNISIVEQEMQEKLIPNFYDAKSVAESKRQYLLALTEAINTEEPDKIKTVLDNAGVNYIDLGKDEKNIPSFATPEEAETSGYKGKVVIGGRPARID